jgi:hypothetical protein
VSWTQDRPGIQSVARLTDKADITLTATGPSPRNEEDALEICGRFVRVLNSAGDDWSAPAEGEHDIDAYSVNATGEKLEMQVVRASNNGNLWQELNEAGSAKVNFDASKAAGELMDAIRKKSAKYSSVQKKVMTLVLDAGRTPSHTFRNVFDAFRNEYLEESQKAGFRDVWAVGPNDSIVVRLDM